MVGMKKTARTQKTLTQKEAVLVVTKLRRTVDAASYGELESMDALLRRLAVPVPDSEAMKRAVEIAESIGWFK